MRRRTPFSPLSIAADTRIAPSTLRFVRISLAPLAQSPPPNLPWPPRAITLACLAQSPWLVSLLISLGRLDLPCSPGQSPLTASLDHACSRSITLGPLARSHSATSISLGHLDFPCLPRSPLAPRSDSTLLRRCSQSPVQRPRRVGREPAARGGGRPRQALSVCGVGKGVVATGGRGDGRTQCDWQCSVTDGDGRRVGGR